jgi:hypothetical protein
MTMPCAYEQPGPPWGRRWGWDPAMTPAGRRAPARPDPTMRVSDAERTEVTNALCRHFGDGRLDEAELNDRLAQATAAKTRADLEPLLTDLPSFETAPPPPRPRQFRPMAWMLVGLLVAVTVLASLAGSAWRFHTHIPWLLIVVAAFVFLRMGRHRHHHHHL